jgi:archaellum component FlaC
MGVEYWAGVAQIASVVGGMLFALWKIWRKIDQHQANSAARSDVLETRLDRIESQFGPNGGGLREAVNHISKNLSKMDSKIDNVTKEVSELKGEFRQHVRENREHE